MNQKQGNTKSGFYRIDDFAKLRKIDYPPIYLLGGSACIIAGYLDRATTDIDLLDMEI